MVGWIVVTLTARFGLSILVIWVTKLIVSEILTFHQKHVLSEVDLERRENRHYTKTHRQQSWCYRYGSGTSIYSRTHGLQDNEFEALPTDLAYTRGGVVLGSLSNADGEAVYGVLGSIARTFYVHGRRDEST